MKIILNICLLLVTITNMNGQNLAEALRQGKTDKFLELIKDPNVDIDAVDAYGNTALHHAAYYKGYLPFLEMLLKRGAKTEIRNEDGATPLYHSIPNLRHANEYKKEYSQKIRLLLEHGTDVNANGKYLPSIFYVIDDEANLKLWLTKIEEVNERNHFPFLMARGGDTPLHWAAQYGNRTTVQLLLDKGADVNAKDDAGWLPLHCAIWGANVEIVQLFLDKNPDRSTRTTQKFEVLWGGEAEKPFPAGSTFLEVALIAQENAHRHGKTAADYDELIKLLGD